MKYSDIFPSLRITDTRLCPKSMNQIVKLTRGAPCLVCGEHTQYYDTIKGVFSCSTECELHLYGKVILLELKNQ